jgi:hypothetical protein
MNKIAIAAELLKEKAASTTDGTAFIVKVYKNSENEECRISLTADYDRRGDHDSAFYHMDAVADICHALHLSSYLCCKIVNREDGPSATFDVQIY